MKWYPLSDAELLGMSVSVCSLQRTKPAHLLNKSGFIKFKQAPAKLLKCSPSYERTLLKGSSLFHSMAHFPPRSPPLASCLGVPSDTVSKLWHGCCCFVALVTKDIHSFTMLLSAPNSLYIFKREGSSTLHEQEYYSNCLASIERLKRRADRLDPFLRIAGTQDHENRKLTYCLGL